jgi:hypothetical protein
VDIGLFFTLVGISLACVFTAMAYGGIKADKDKIRIGAWIMAVYFLVGATLWYLTPTMTTCTKESLIWVYAVVIVSTLGTFMWLTELRQHSKKPISWILIVVAILYVIAVAIISELPAFT